MIDSAAHAAQTPEPAPNMTTLADLFKTAALHVNGASFKTSAELRLNDGLTHLRAGNLADAARCATNSLKYSVGILSPLYAQAVIVVADQPRYSPTAAEPIVADLHAAGIL